uniref:MAP7 domain containing 2a n=1 Tax=Poecilia latipinna TaxID=48699 RepID=A0A3B3VCV7_9TELE
MNGHASPSHLTSNNHGGKQSECSSPTMPSPLQSCRLFPDITANLLGQEGYMKTDDRMRLAKERREERDRSLAAREQLIREKERRARLQYERTVEERWRRLEEQRQKEELRRAAVEEKRRQQLEEERERLEALMKRSLERSLQLEQRTKRWGRGYPPGAGIITIRKWTSISDFIIVDGNMLSCIIPSPMARLFALVNILTRNMRKRIGSGCLGYLSGLKSLLKKRLRRERRTASPVCGSPVRRSESPASVTSLSFCRLASKTRTQSPGSSPQYHRSPTRCHPNQNDDRKGEDKKLEKKGEQPKAESAARTSAETKNLNSSSQAVANTSTGKVGAGTTNAEEATRLLAERRRQARIFHFVNVSLFFFYNSLAKEDAERQRQGREQQTQQEEEERQLRKKRIEEIMKRTRKSEADMKVLAFKFYFFLTMCFSPASKEELISIPEYSPNNEIEQGFMSHNQALKDLMDLTGSVTHTKLPSESTIGDCNKNLIRGVVSPMTDSKLIGVAPPSSNKLSV